MKIKVIEKGQDDKEKELRDTVDITDTIERMGDNTFYRFNCVEIEGKNGEVVITFKLNNNVMSSLRGVNFGHGDIISIKGFNATSDVTMSWDK